MQGAALGWACGGHTGRAAPGGSAAEVGPMVLWRRSAGPLEGLWAWVLQESARVVQSSQASGRAHIWGHVGDASVAGVIGERPAGQISH